jgi:hypothetical protein
MMKRGCDPRTAVVAPSVCVAKTVTDVDEMTLAIVYVPLYPEVVTPRIWIVAPACGDPCGISMTMVMVDPTVVPDAVKLTMSLFGLKSVPDDHKNPFPDWYRNTFLD